MQTADCQQNLRKTLSSSQQGWPYWLAWAFWCVGLASIVIGHTVTSYTAGMAIPDWPTTYGHFPLLFPLNEWFQYWDVFLAQSHRFVVTVLLLFSIILTVVFWTIRRHPHKWLATGVFVLICLQAALGASRVVSGDILLATIHGCVGPLCFGLITILLLMSSPAYERLSKNHSVKPRRWHTGATLALLIVLLAFVQLVLIGQLRHVLPQQSPLQALLIVIAQIVLWVVLGALVILTAVVLQKPSCNPITRRLLWLVIVLYCVHLLLGVSAWIVNFNFPSWFLFYVLAVEYTIVQGGAFQAIVSTVFALVTSLFFAGSLALLMCVVANRGTGTDSNHK